MRTIPETTLALAVASAAERGARRRRVREALDEA
jgi:hypothetical protein